MDEDNRRKSLILPTLKRNRERRRSSRIRFLPGPSDLARVAKTLDRVESADEGLDATARTEDVKPLSLWEKLTAASHEEEERRQSVSLAPAADAVPSSLTNPSAGNVESDASDDHDTISFGFAASGSGTDEGEEKPKRFRVLARMVKNNLAWARDVRDKHDEDTTRFVVRTGAEDGEALVFDLNNFKYQQRSYGGLTPRARRVLLKHPVERTASELQMLRDVVDRLKCFQKYHRKMKMEIARVIFYEGYEDGRVIIQQGHCGVSFYFIVSGKVQIKIEELDKKTGLMHTQVLGELCEGSSFGELALLHNIRRTATIVCKGNNCEFLRVDKADFESVLRSSYQQEWQERLNMLRAMPYFKTWPESAIANCNNTCKMKEYLSGAVILNGQTRGEDHIYFVTLGECMVVREIYLLTENLPFGGQKVIFPTDTMRKKLMRRRHLMDRRLTMCCKMERRFWQICTLKKGYYFNAGEDLTDTHIVANDRVECLLIPRMQFIKYGNSKVLDKMRDDLDHSLPSNEEAFTQYIEDIRWAKYKRSVITDILGKKPNCKVLKKSVTDKADLVKYYIYNDVGELK